MGKFEYRLETLLRLREEARDEYRRRLGEAYEAEKHLKQQRDELNTEIQNLYQQSHTMSRGTVDVDAVLDRQRHQLALQAKKKMLAEQKALLEVETEKRRLALVEANREAEVLVRHRQMQAARFRQQEEKRLTKQLDEIASSAFVRRSERC